MAVLGGGRFLMSEVPLYELGRCEDRVLDEPASGRYIDCIRGTPCKGRTSRGN